LENNWNGSKVNPDRIEIAWFVFRILEFITVFNPWPRCTKTKSLDLELLCKEKFAEIRMIIDKKWMGHACNEPGCKERFIVIDGNEKLYRFICATEKKKVMGNPGEVNSYELCIGNPVRGNQYKNNDKYCQYHVNEESAATIEQLDMRLMTRSLAKLMPFTVTSGEGCKQEEKVDKFFLRTAGMFYVFRSCGIRLGNFEMYTAESLSSVFTYLLDLFGERYCLRPCL